ncbi:lytic transglycosylase [Cyanobium gracile]|uniref:LysM peptidoglycan-binding domain-containing protein n=1 Tax=Cyanobium gracile UHCC 0281 TaxID=3110309 RepID=A0ABU5STB5_9CYAN|nr:LysM peptidoglycan-binding domain-containing protein [Cyanobium gracile]MEA5441312.1 LysM peptidoglycan-binding domain-containing protein [Cyanobium gracile UHCC 0281]
MKGFLAALVLCSAGFGFSPEAFAQSAAPVRSVKVVQGDTLEALAARYGVSVQDLMRLNTITRPEELQIGQSLKLPPSKGLVQVRTGDTLAVLAARHRTTVAELQKANPGVKPDQLKVGAWLKLPARPPVAKAKPTATAAANAKPAPKPTATVAAKPTVAPKPTVAVKPPTPAGPPPVKAPAPTAPPSPVPPQPAEAVRWRFYGNTLVDWGGWKLHPGGVRVSLVQPTQAEVGPIRAQATAVAVHCSSLRQAWLINGAWGPWEVPEGRSVAQQIVLDLCANVSDPTAPAVPPPSAP